MEIFEPAAHPLAHPAVKQILELAREQNLKLYLVGGYLRDQLMRRTKESGTPLDFDFTVIGGSAVEFAQLAAQKLSGHFVLLDTANDTARVVLPDGDFIDLALCVGGELEVDIRRRDFTINSLAWDPENPEKLIDYLGSAKDIEQKRIRLISEQALIDDPLRLLRAFRFSAALSFTIDPESLSTIAKHVALISNVKAERITYELLMMLNNRSEDCLRQMASIGLLEEIFAELKETRRVSSNDYHHLALFEHSLETAIQCERAFQDMPAWAQRQMETKLSSSVSRFAAAKLAALLHDIGKPDTWVITEEGKHTFIGHDKLGAQMCEPIAKRLKWSKPFARFVDKLVRWHLRPGHLFQQGEPTQRAVYRFYRAIEEETPELILLALADFRSTCGPGLQEGRGKAEEKLFELLGTYCVYLESQNKRIRLLDGKEVMSLLKIEPGPMIGEILDELDEAQGLGEVQGRLQAEEFVRELYEKKYSR